MNIAFLFYHVTNLKCNLNICLGHPQIKRFLTCKSEIQLLFA